MADFTGAGIYPDMPEGEYHADPVPGGSLSRSGARKLLPPYCPAVFDWERKHPKPRTKAMDLGTVVHGLLLGSGQGVEVLDYPNYTTKKAQDDRKRAQGAGRITLLTHEWLQALAIEAAVRDDDLAGPLFDKGTAEQSLFWHDPEFGIWKRARPDWVTGHGELVDLKTCASADPEAVAKSIRKYGYYMQDPFYREGWEAVTGEFPDFLFVNVQTEEPYLVTVTRLTSEYYDLGEYRNRQASEIYRDCTASGLWPGYASEIVRIRPPRWLERQIESEQDNDW